MLFKQIICGALIHDRLIWFLFIDECDDILLNQTVFFISPEEKSKEFMKQLIALNHSSKEIFERPNQ